MSLCLSCHNVSVDMQHDLPGSFIWVILQVSKVKFSNWLFGVSLHFHTFSVSLRLDAKNTMVLLLSLFPSFSARNLFSKTTILLKSNISLFGLPWERQNVTCPGHILAVEGSRSGHGWLQNVLFCLCCEALCQLRGKWAGVDSSSLSHLGWLQVRSRLAR